MSYEGTYEVFADGESAGWVTLSPDKLMTRFTYGCDGTRELARLVLVTVSGALSIGIPAPVEGGMALKKSFSRSALDRLDWEGAVRFLLAPVDADIQSLTPESAVEEAPSAPAGSTPETIEAPPEPAPVPEPPVTGDWYREPDPASRFSDPVLQEAARGLENVLVRMEGDDALLAFPFSPSEPFPMLPAFRSGAAASIGGKSYMVFRLREGTPV